MPCLSSSAFSALKVSISVSKAESQFALPLAITTFFGSSVVSRPKGSAVWTGAVAAGGFAAAAGGAVVLGAGEALAAGAGLVSGEGVALAAGDGDADGAGKGLADAAGAGLGDCAKAPDRPKEMAAAGISAAKARQKMRFILFILPRAEPMPRIPVRAKCAVLTR